MLMALSVSCSCGARFEVDETFAGHTVSCPECNQAVPAPSLVCKSLRTSGFAVASVVLALVLAFTGIGTVLAVILGVVALFHIARHRDEVTGTGYAVFGIASGAVFSILFVLAIIRTELFGFDLAREGLMGDKIDRSGPLEVSRPDDGFAIRRPSNKWGIAKGEFARNLVPDSELVLVNIARDAYIDVTADALAGRSLEDYREQLLDTFKTSNNLGKRSNAALQFHDLTVRQKTQPRAADDPQTLEVLLDVRMGAQPLTYLIRLVRPAGSDRVFLVRAWTQKRRFGLIEPEVRQALDSFRVLKP
jgi:hypothetical protein